MLDIGFLELMLISVVALLVLGPERLPKAARTAGLWIGKIKRTVSGMQREISAQLEAEELRQKLNEQQSKLNDSLKKPNRMSRALQTPLQPRLPSPPLRQTPSSGSPGPAHDWMTPCRPYVKTCRATPTRPIKRIDPTHEHVWQLPATAQRPGPCALIEHLIELRSRLMKAVVVILVIFLGLYAFANDIYTFVAEPLMALLPEGSQMIATEVASPFMAPFKLTLVVAVFIAIPFVLHQAWPSWHRGSTITRKRWPFRSSFPAWRCFMPGLHLPITWCSRCCSSFLPKRGRKMSR